MTEEQVSLVTLKQTIQKLIEIYKTLYDENMVSSNPIAPLWLAIRDVRECVEKLQKQQEQKMNVIIRIKSLKAREHFARRLGFENLGHLIGGHALSTEWKETDWLPENLPPFLGKRKVKEVLGEGNKS